MHIQTINDQKLWQEFINKQNYNTFLHSLGWIDFNQQRTQEIWQLGLFEKENLISVALVLKIQAKRGTFLFIPHGPQSCTKLDENDPDSSQKLQAELKFWTEYLKKFGKENGCSFIRIQPILPNSKTSQELFAKCDFRPAPIHMHTELSTVLDITPSNEDILIKMRKTTRQMIRKGDNLIQSGEVVIEHPSQITDEMHEVYLNTVHRGQFVPYSREFLQTEYDSFNKKEKVLLTTVKYENKILSWGMVLVAGKRAFYHQGANILHKQIPASYICQWQGIQYAKSQNCISYDFWGVAPQKEPNHPWANISLFKRGFAGEDVELLHAQDYILDLRYWINWIIETYRAKKRGFH